VAGRFLLLQPGHHALVAAPLRSLAQHDSIA
jgi:hypothetical protein